jgi:hypothetical protein
VKELELPRIKQKGRGVINDGALSMTGKKQVCWVELGEKEMNKIPNFTWNLFYHPPTITL